MTPLSWTPEQRQRELRRIANRLPLLPKMWGVTTHDAQPSNKSAWEERKGEGEWMKQVVNVPRKVEEASPAIPDAKVRPIKSTKQSTRKRVSQR